MFISKHPMYYYYFTFPVITHECPSNWLLEILVPLEKKVCFMCNQYLYNKITLGVSSHFGELGNQLPKLWAAVGINHPA